MADSTISLALDGLPDDLPRSPPSLVSVTLDLASPAGCIVVSILLVSLPFMSGRDADSERHDSSHSGELLGESS
jgi:hypothetical protein